MVAGASGVQALAGVADSFGQPRLDIQVHVFEVCAPLEAATLDVGEDRVKTGDNFLDIAAIEHANLAEHARVRLAAGNVLAIQARVKAHRLGEFLDEGRGGFGEAAAPQFLICRSEEHTSELQSLMRISYAVFCLNQKTQ